MQFSLLWRCVLIYKISTGSFLSFIRYHIFSLSYAWMAVHSPRDLHLWLYVPAVFQTLSSDLRPQDSPVMKPSAVHTRACHYSMSKGWWVNSFCEIQSNTHMLKRRGGSKEIVSGLQWTSLHPVCDPTVMIFLHLHSSQLPTGHSISHRTYRWRQIKPDDLLAYFTFPVVQSWSWLFQMKINLYLNVLNCFVYQK